MLEDGWQRLVGDAWRIFDGFAEREFVVRPSLPILFFGDLKAYLASPVRVLTVGLNPSAAEFPETEPFARFEGAADLCATPPPARDAAFAIRYLEILSRYFRVRPYLQWFSSYQMVLQGMGVSYLGSLTRVALHTDLFSPLGTIPAWSRLDRSHRAELRDAGVAVWHRLVRKLSPTVILASLARKYLGLLGCPFRANWSPICQFTHKLSGDPRRRPYVVERAVTDGEPPVRIVFGPAAQTPFGLISSEEKRQVGAYILEDVYSR